MGSLCLITGDLPMARAQTSFGSLPASAWAQRPSRPDDTASLQPRAPRLCCHALQVISKAARALGWWAVSLALLEWRRGPSPFPHRSSPVWVQALSCPSLALQQTTPRRLGPELGCPGCLIRGSAGHARKLMENLRYGTITPNWTSRIRLKKTDNPLTPPQGLCF